eukprot:scaffold1876_cov350-Prasinococcus_capsulatus_cf.AAC.1
MAAAEPGSHVDAITRLVPCGRESWGCEEGVMVVQPSDFAPFDAAPDDGPWTMDDLLRANKESLVLPYCVEYEVCH